MSDTNQNVDLGRLEGLLTDLSKSLEAQQEAAAEAEADNSVEIIAKGADAIIEQNKEQNALIEKAMTSLIEKIDALDAKIQSMVADVDAKIEKGLADIAAVPAAPKAVVTAEAEPAPAEVEAVEATADAPAPITYEAVLNKAIAELKTAQGDRKMALMKGIAKLDSNFAPADVAAELHLA
jgi:hypothetical protein